MSTSGTGASNALMRPIQAFVDFVSSDAVYNALKSRGLQAEKVAEEMRANPALAKKIMPAHVPQSGFERPKSRKGSISP